MLMLDDWHPDIFEFIASKRQRGMIENANISVLVSDRFMETLARDGDWDLMFPTTSVRVKPTKIIGRATFKNGSTKGTL